MKNKLSAILAFTSILTIGNASAENWSPWNNNNNFNPSSFGSNGNSFGPFNGGNNNFNPFGGGGYQPFGFNSGVQPFGFNTGSNRFGQ
jgi:hypothetical protein